jgi:hypothetical protein
MPTMGELKIRQVATNIQGEGYSDSDYQRAESWVEQNVPITEIQSISSGRRAIVGAAPGPRGVGMRKMANLGRFDKTMFEGHFKDALKTVTPPPSVKNVEEWRDNKTNFGSRAWRTGRYSYLIDVHEEPIFRADALFVESTNLGRANSTLERDFQMLSALGYIEQLDDGRWQSTAAGRKEAKSWRRK